MGKLYRWDEDFIYKKINSLVAKYDSRYYRKKKDEIIDALDAYSDIKKIINSEKEDDKLYTPEEFFNEMTRYKNEHPFCFSKSARDFINKVSCISPFNGEFKKDFIISEEDLIDHTIDFFKVCDSYNIIHYISQKKNPSLFHFGTSDDNQYGMTYIDPYHNIPYVLTNRRNDFSDVFTVAHESGHAIGLELANYYCWGNIIPTEEFMACLTEIMLADYQYNIGYNIEQNHNINILNYNRIINAANTAQQQLLLFHKMKSSRHKDYDKIVDGIPKKALTNILSADGDYMYELDTIYSFIYANEVIYQYKQDNNTKDPINIIKLLFKGKIISKGNLTIDENLHELSNSFKEKYKVNVLK